MFSTLRNRFGIPGVISVIALVFAMFGGAYAASNSSGGGKATASAKAKKGPRGPKGATGPAGPAGSQGPAGANGKDGSNGANGSNGATGATGANGQSVTTTAEPPLAHCGDQEGVKLHSVSGDNYVCNGEDGEDGEDGEPWAAGGTLPGGATETGLWSYGEVPGGSPIQFASLLFTIPLPSALDLDHVHYINNAGKEVIFEVNEEEGKEFVGFKELSSAACHGSVEAPSADPGNLCVYAGRVSNSKIYTYFKLVSEGETFKVGSSIETALGGMGTSTVGAVLKAEKGEGAGTTYGIGTWAVTG
jgi:hypothetical protein